MTRRFHGPARMLLALLLPFAAARAHSPHDVVEAWAMSPDFGRDGTLFASLPRFNLLVRTTDGGHSFRAAMGGLDTGYVTALAISPDFAHDRTVYALEIGGLFASRDAGDHWTRVEGPRALREAGSIAISPAFARDGTLALGTQRGLLLVTHDRGATWDTIRDPEVGARQPVGPLAFAPAGTAGGRPVLYGLLPGKGLFRWAAGLTSLQPLRGPPASASWCALALPPSPADPAAEGTGTSPAGSGGTRPDPNGPDPLLWVAGHDGGVWRAEGEGKALQWARCGELPKGADVLQLATAREADGSPVVFASTANDGVQVLRGDGAWSEDRTGFREPTHQTKTHWLGTMPSPDFARDHVVFAACFEGLYVSRTGGTDWHWLVVLGPAIVRNLAFSPHFADDATFWLSTYGNGLLESSDRGDSFTRLDSADWSFPDGIAVNPDWPGDGTVLIGTPNRLLISEDGGRSSKPTLTGAKGFPRVLAFAPDWATSRTAFAHLSTDTGLATNRFVRTTDGGATWTDTNVRSVYDVAFDPGYAAAAPGDPARRLWVGCPDGLYVSTDDGARFAKVEALAAGGINSVSAAPGGPDGAWISVASRSQGILLSRDGGASWTRRMEGLGDARAAFVRLSPDVAHGGPLFAGTPHDGLWSRRADDAGWTRLPAAPATIISFELSPDFARDHALLVGAYEGPWLSTDAGATWRALTLPPQPPEMAAFSLEPGETR